MSKQVEVEINYDGLLELLKNPSVQESCIEVGNRVANIAGEGYNVSEWRGPHRAGATVWCDNPKAIQENLDNNTLLKALGATVPANKIVTKV